MSLIFPASPTDGQVELLGGRQYIWSAAKARWENYGGFAQISYTRPTTPAQGELFFNPDANLFEVWDVDQWKQLSTGGGEVTPIGTIQYFSAATPPTGYLVCDGSTIPNGSGTVQGITADFSSLYAVIGSIYGSAGKLPDLRGEFIRGADQGRGIDSGRTLGSGQGHQIQVHDHNLYVEYGTTNVNAPAPGGQYQQVDQNRTYNYVDNNSIETFGTQGNFGQETRPRNVALLPCIKYSGYQSSPSLSTIPVDPLYNDVILHLKGNDLTDSGPRGLTATTSANVTGGNDVANSKWGDGSLAFTGDGFAYNGGVNSGWTLQGSFTVEMWAKPLSRPSAGNTNGLFFWGSSVSNDYRFQIDHQDDGELTVYTQLGTGTGSTVSTGKILPLSTWSHVAVTKTEDAIFVFVNGVLSAVNFDDTNWADSGFDFRTVFFVGQSRQGGTNNEFTGYIEDFRLTAGVRYTNGFPVPTTRFASTKPYLTAIEAATPTYIENTVNVTTTGVYDLSFPPVDGAYAKEIWIDLHWVRPASSLFGFLARYNNNSSSWLSYDFTSVNRRAQDSSTYYVLYGSNSSSIGAGFWNATTAMLRAHFVKSSIDEQWMATLTYHNNSAVTPIGFGDASALFNLGTNFLDGIRITDYSSPSLGITSGTPTPGPGVTPRIVTRYRV